MVTEPCGCEWHERGEHTERKWLTVECGYHFRLHEQLLESGRTCSRLAARVSELEKKCDEADRILAEQAARLAEMKRQAERWTETYSACLEDREQLRKKWDERGNRARIERDEARAQATELERERDSLAKISMSAVREADALRQTLDTERQAAVATAEELERVRLELAALRNRYRPRRQEKEPAPDGVVLIWAPKDPGGPAGWCYATHEDIQRDDIWTHQPPAPGEGE